ncbi:MAG: zinc ABC transporter substrate-binding protein [Clostridia bacterium]|nr:zinc ABC transporter substrate-binding protein [Clostridia bacterium]
MKRYTALAAALLILAAACLVSCSGGAGDGGRISIVATVFPEYDWIKNILGDDPAGVELTLLLDSGSDLHSFQPTAADIMKISSCDLFVYVGGESDEWIKDALSGASNKNMTVVNLMEVLDGSLRIEEEKEGMQEEEEEEEEHGHGHGEDEGGYDEHVWLSLRNAKAVCAELAKALGKVDPQNAALYMSNAEAYCAELEALDAEYAAAVAAGSIKTLLFCDRFPFRYLTADYGLDYYAAFAGCSAETEASFETVIFLAKKIDELGLHTVLTTEGSDGRLASTVIQNTARKDTAVAVLDSMQGTTSRDAASGVTYLSVMRSNLEVLREALK